MFGLPASRTAAVTSAAVQTAVGVGVHVAAAGCLPGATALLALPAAFVGVLLLGRLLADRPILALATGQLTVHGALAAVAACSGQAAGHASGHGTQAGLMTFAHVGAVVLCRVLVVRAVVLVERAASVAAGLLARVVRPLGPIVVALLTTRCAVGRPSSLTSRLGGGIAPVRGPPRAAFPLPG